MDICLYDDFCLSFIYYRMEQKCKLLSFTRHDTSTKLTIIEPLVDYYELACDRMINNTKTLSLTENNEQIESILPTTLTPLIENNTIINNTSNTELTTSNNEVIFKSTNENDKSENNKNQQENFKQHPDKILNEEMKKIVELLDPIQNQSLILNKINVNKSNNSMLDNEMNKNITEQNFSNCTTSESNMNDNDSQIVRTLIASGRTLRLEYRNLHHINVLDVSKCEALCYESLANCSTFAYNEQSKDCLLSTTPIQRSNARFVLFTQSNHNYDLYAYNATTAQLKTKQKNCELIVEIKEYKNDKILSKELNISKNNIDFQNAEDLKEETTTFSTSTISMAAITTTSVMVTKQLQIQESDNELSVNLHLKNDRKDQTEKLNNNLAAIKVDLALTEDQFESKIFIFNTRLKINI